MPASFDSDVDIKVEVAFDSEPFASSQSFTDISAFVIKIIDLIQAKLLIFLTQLMVEQKLHHLSK